MRRVLKSKNKQSQELKLPASAYNIGYTIDHELTYLIITTYYFSFNYLLNALAFYGISQC